jgi:glucose/mannose-6-phosphate isomerase
MLTYFRGILFMAITHEHSLIHFHNQIEYALSNYTSHGLKARDFNNVVIGGLGGSGIGGRLASLCLFDKASVPVEVYSEYRLPAYVSEKTLVILSSYSGNTEETLAMFHDARERGASIICIVSGGRLSELAEAHGYRCYKVETGYQPRMALGFSFSLQLLILGELFGLDMATQLNNIATKLHQESDALQKKAKDMHAFFSTAIDEKFVVVCDKAFEAAAIRFCQQIQENAKGEAFVNVLPEANHNVIESYYEKRDSNFILLNSRLNERTNLRFRFLESVLSEQGNRVFNYDSPDFSLWSLFEFIHVTDWLSIYASNSKGVNNMEVGIISRLKQYLDSH